jgi:hypothetical protein
VTLSAGARRFADVAELARLIGADDRAAACAAKQVFRWGLGREPAPADACSLEALEAALRASGGDVRGLPVALTKTDAFLYRSEER